MATATRKNPPNPPPRAEASRAEPSSAASIVVRAFDATFRFLASLKLAVLCLAALAATLAYGTWFNSSYGMAAATEWIYSARWFALLLAFLGTNILCAALIRYPWTKRQTGFVITHAGLLIVIAGSWWAAQTSDEGQVGMREGETSSKLIRNHKPAFYLRTVDPHSGKASEEFNLPFRPGTFDWPTGKYEVVSKVKDPFKLAVKKFYVASRPRTVFLPDPSGTPMARIRPRVKPPKSDGFVDALTGDDQWFVPSTRGVQRIVKDATVAQFAFTYAEDHDVFDDFVEPPADPGIKGVVRFHYDDRAEKHRSHDVKLDEVKPGQAIALPESDLTATFIMTDAVPMRDPAFVQMAGEDVLKIVQFNVKKGNGPEVEHNGYAGLPTIPPIVPKRDAKEGETPRALLSLLYYLPPAVDPATNRRFGMIEVLGDDHGRLAYRVYKRGTPGVLASHGLLKVGESVTAFGGSDLSPMTMTFSVEEFLQSGKEEEIAESIKLPPNEEGLAAVLAELTVKGVTKEVWLQKSPTFEPEFKTVTFPDAIYEVAFDVDRMDLGFSLKLDDFDVGFDPGTQTASSFRSEVKLTDEAEGIKDKPASIFMNNTLDHRGWRFFQSNYMRYRDPKTRQFTGEFVSVFQVAKNPAREIIYVGCIVVVLGAFVQFYMRAGLFTDGGKLQQKREAEKARKRLEAKFGKLTPPEGPAAPDVEEAL